MTTERGGQEPREGNRAVPFACPGGPPQLRIVQHLEDIPDFVTIPRCR